RRAAEAFSRDNIERLKQRGLDPTFSQLRLAFLLGAADAARLIQAQPETPASQILSPSVIKANPFMAHMTAGDLIAKGARDVDRDRSEVLAESAPAPRSRPPAIVRPGAGAKIAIVRRDSCSAKLASCRKFSVLHSRKGAPSR